MAFDFTNVLKKNDLTIIQQFVKKKKLSRIYIGIKKARKLSL